MSRHPLVFEHAYRENRGDDMSVRKPFYRILFLLTGTTLLLFTGCSALLLHPERQHAPNPVAERFSPQDVYFPSGDGETLHGWFFRAQNPKATVLVFHGNAGNISVHVNSVLWLAQEGFNLFVVDGRGFGHSTGEPDLAGLHHDGLAAFQYLLSLPGVDRTRIAILGQSLGASVATYVAATAPERERVNLLLLEGGFFSYQQIAREKLAGVFITWPFQYPLSWLFSDAYSPGRWIGQVTAPVVIIHDRDDKTIPYHHGEQLYAAGRGPKELLTTSGQGHIGSFADAALRSKVAELIAGSLPDT
jgi:fermentation-respiration switch protein FrsA (DUF1100 family)